MNKSASSQSGCCVPPNEGIEGFRAYQGITPALVSKVGPLETVHARDVLMGFVTFALYAFGLAVSGDSKAQLVSVAFTISLAV